MEIYDAKSALDTFQFILSNGSTFTSGNFNNNQNELTVYNQQLTNIVQIYSGRQTLIDLIGKFFEFSNIYLHFIAFNDDQGKFQIINKYFFQDKTKRKALAFVVLNGDHTICGPLSVLFKK